MSKIKEVFFDCDGTLVDSEIIAMRVAGEVLLAHVQEQKEGIYFDLDGFVQDYAGWHFDQMISTVAGEHGVSIDAAAATSDKTKKTLSALEQVSPVDGIHTSIENLLEKGISISLVSSSELDRIEICKKATSIDAFFPDHVTFSAHNSLKVPAHKPKPDIYLHALQQRGLQADEVVSVEDSTSGVKSSIAAGITCIGYVGASHIPENRKEDKAKELMDLGASIVLRDMKHLPVVVENIHDLSMVEKLLPKGSFYSAANLQERKTGIKPSPATALLPEFRNI